AAGVSKPAGCQVVEEPAQRASRNRRRRVTHAGRWQTTYWQIDMVQSRDLAGRELVATIADAHSTQNASGLASATPPSVTRRAFPPSPHPPRPRAPHPRQPSAARMTRAARL